MKNKRADIAITLLVFLTLLVVGATLFIFMNNSGKIEKELINPRVVEKVYVEENKVKFYVKQAGERSLVKTYKEFVKGEGVYDYLQSRQTTTEGVKFENLNSKLDERFLERFKVNFDKEIKNYDFSEDISFTLSGKGNDFEVFVGNLEFIESGSLEIIYKPKVNLNFNLQKIGLHGFEEIFNVKENCKSKEGSGEKEFCFSQK